ncbi:hypothetical protein FA95DRAFT_1562977 [Auriscalpium vulgare]|uniref:Uncharacterized protein n=1 Tax=Auriscalpium vulgare TaxID=40419 RepID=A0ACB8RI09_9AGAM|nr:hypothetical protein FA95DRAFT_1562977 [Auriscalpium vulgare]
MAKSRTRRHANPSRTAQPAHVSQQRVCEGIKFALTAGIRHCIMSPDSATTMGRCCNPRTGLCSARQSKTHPAALSAHTHGVLIVRDIEPDGVLFVATRDGTYHDSESAHGRAGARGHACHALPVASHGTTLAHFREDPSHALRAPITEVAWITLRPHAAAQRGALARHLDVLAAGMRIWAQETGQRMPHVWGLAVGARDTYVALTGWPEEELCARRSQSPAFKALMAEVEELAVVEVLHARLADHEGL